MKKVFYLFLALAVCLSSCRPTAVKSLAELKSEYLNYDGTDIHYKMLPSKEGKDLVFVHGWGCDMNAWKEQFSCFAGKNTLIFIDLPGFGLSGKPYDKEYTLDYLSGAVEEVLKHLNVNKPVLIGHSLGTPVCRQLLLTQYPLSEGDTLGKLLRPGAMLVDVDGVYCFYPPDGTPERAEYDAAVQGFAYSFTSEAFPSILDNFISGLFIESTPPSVREYASLTMESTLQYVGSSVMKNLIDTKYWDGPTITCPTLAVWSKYSGVPEHYEDVLKPLYHDLQWKEFSNTGHFIMMEDPDTFNSLIEKFI